MALQPNYETIKIDCEKRIVSSQAVVEARLLPQPNIVISRVLSISCDSYVSPSDIFTGEVRYSGKVNFKVLFIDVDGENHSIDYILDFNDKINSDDITNNTHPILTSKVLDIDIRGVSSGEIKLAAVLEIDIDSTASEEISYLSDVGEGVYTNTDNINTTQLVYEGKENFVIEDNLEQENISSILLCEARVVVDKRTLNIDTVIFEGKVIADICTQNDQGELINIQRTTPFTQELRADNARMDDIIISKMQLVDYKAELSDKEEKTSIKLTFNIVADYLIYKDIIFTPIIDAFCPTNELLTKGESISLYYNKLNTTINDSISGSVTLDNTMPLLDNILYCGCSKVSITNCTAHKGYAVIEGIMNANIIYYNSESSTKNSLAVEVPFSLSSQLNCNEDDKIVISGEVGHLGVKIRRGNELDIKADICLDINVIGENVYYIITELSLGEEIIQPSSSITIYITKGGENLWDIAKALSTTPEKVMIQNPDLTIPANKGERIIGYRNMP